MTKRPGVQPDPALGLIELYDAALPQVYGYLLSRCGSRAVAEELTADTFLAAVDTCRRADPPALSTGWLIGVARHKLVDHWRRAEREQRNLRLLEGDLPIYHDPWEEEELDILRARQVLAALGSHHRAALTLRYLDGLPVPQVAAYLGRTLHATEALLVRARTAFRRAYSDSEGSDD